MKIRYLVEIDEPQKHLAKVTISGTKPANSNKLSFYLPSWSPGSYLMREYARNIRTVAVLNGSGESLYFEQLTKNEWVIDWDKIELNSKDEKFDIQYEIYCHELTVRTSHIDESHAFLHGPSFLMGIKDTTLDNPEIQFRFPALWSKISTGLTDIGEGSNFIYTAENYDVLIDAPVEIGCHETDGFMAFDKKHFIANYGEIFPHENNLKEDIKTIVETVGSHFSDIPYDHYTFMTHFVPNLFGGLEHLNSTALQFDGRKLSSRKDYINWLALVAHEYFHTWNVKRIRPVELGPFNYTEENYTKMHWLTEGLTSFMDELFVLRSKLCTLTEYLEMQKDNLNRYFGIHGKKFHSLEQSSFNAWVKLYRPDENSDLSSISYYLKGGLVFSTLHFEMKKAGKNINDLLTALWERFKDNQSIGVNHEEVMSMVESIAGKKVRDNFELRLTTTEDIDFESMYQEIGCEFVWDEPNEAELGCTFTSDGQRCLINRVIMDGPAFKCGLNAGDEIIAIDGTRFLNSDSSKVSSFLMIDKTYVFTVSRLNKLENINVLIEKKPRVLKEIKVLDEAKTLATFVK